MEKISDNQLILEAVHWYSRMRHSFANDIAQKTYRKSDGSTPTAKEVKHALYMTRRCDEVLNRLSKEIKT